MPKQRRVSKAVAQLNALLREQLKVDRGLLGFWAAAKAYVGEFRVTGLSPEDENGAQPPCDVSDVCWLVRDARPAVNVWLDLDPLARGLGLNKADARRAPAGEGEPVPPRDELNSSLYGCDSDVALLEIDDFILLVAKPDADCFADWSSACVGHSHLCCVCLVSVDLSHQGGFLMTFLLLFPLWRTACNPSSVSVIPVLSLVTSTWIFVVDLVIASLVCAHVYTTLVHFSSDSVPTWGVRRLDHIVCNSLVLDRCSALSGHPACPWAGVEVRNDLSHGFLLRELLLRGEGCSSRRRRASGYLAFLNWPCEMNLTNGLILQQKVCAFMDSAMCGALPGTALDVVKHAAQSSAGLGDNTVFVQLDLSQAFDSLFVNAVLAFLHEHWVASSALSVSLLRWILAHSQLRFQLFDFVWWCSQGRGARQGGSHSPTLFGRIVAARFAQLVGAWRSWREQPTVEAGLVALWGLWFIDDSILLFRALAQAVRLMPEVGRFYLPSVPLQSRSDAELDQTIVGIALFFAISITKAFQLTMLRTVSGGRAEKMSGFGIIVKDPAANVYGSPSSQYLWTWRCLQGCFHGQQLIVAEVAHSINHVCFDLDRVLGWRRKSYTGATLTALLAAIGPAVPQPSPQELAVNVGSPVGSFMGSSLTEEAIVPLLRSQEEVPAEAHMLTKDRGMDARCSTVLAVAGAGMPNLGETELVPNNTLEEFRTNPGVGGILDMDFG
eukprot:Skav229554  [mRNA]  locus=scaffold568:384338:388017:+ [translate_table: standard]